MVDEAVPHMVHINALDKEHSVDPFALQEDVKSIHFSTPDQSHATLLLRWADHPTPALIPPQVLR